MSLESQLSDKDIQAINTKKSGIKNRFYKHIDGTRYIGLPNGGIIEKVPLIKGDVTGDLEASKVVKVGSNTASEINAGINQVNINTKEIAKKSDKCFAIAMALIL